MKHNAPEILFNGFKLLIDIHVLEMIKIIPLSVVKYLRTILIINMSLINNKVWSYLYLNPMYKKYRFTTYQTSQIPKYLIIWQIYAFFW
jgi:hypothetical protein